MIYGRDIDHVHGRWNRDMIFMAYQVKDRVYKDLNESDTTTQTRTHNLIQSNG